jgi:hypothetical protein
MVTEVAMTMMFMLIILGVTGKRARQPFSASERGIILAEYCAILQKVRAYWTDPPDEAYWSLQGRLADLRECYCAKVPILPLSRCPFSGQVVHHSIDCHGIDGLWWNCEAPVRPAEHLPPTFFTLTGALKLRGTVAPAPFLCKPGPETPFVIPRLLKHRHIKAVISSLEVGEHLAFPIFYFADPIPYFIDRINTWGTNQYSFISEAGEYCWNDVPYDPMDADFGLAKWIKAGKLLWIAPGDEAMVLQSLVQ